jgi:galactose mutarotase-like enzyme
MMSDRELLSIRSELLRIEIDPMGAEMHRIQDKDGRDLQWNGDPRFWRGRAPILFPIVGALANDQYRIGDNMYHLPRHGFARHRLFTVAKIRPDTVILKLLSDESSLKQYPFRFELTIEFLIQSSTLTTLVVIKNLEDVDVLPASFGFHPAFRWPLPFGQPRDTHAIRFNSYEPHPVRRLNGNGLVMPSKFTTPVVENILALSDSLFFADAVIFDRITSDGIQYGAGEGPYLNLDFPDTPYVGIWSKPGSGFICIEPWHRYADPEVFTGDFREKSGVFLIRPGAEKSCSMAISLIS